MNDDLDQRLRYYRTVNVIFLCLGVAIVTALTFGVLLDVMPVPVWARTGAWFVSLTVIIGAHVWTNRAQRRVITAERERREEQLRARIASGELDRR
ncbi:hypothetical protein [Micromonospora sp. WMMC273]|uniref:hypothetical protein n=1 Tax=Micromonospora sp. WMMC273 TaxID=3015157 RepID=UPI0022B6F21E|nr:hypothetical protein [Micromonospora sp. WMMC273]MCZ7478820.1 hypothetical protein [Micromonospora sp. WMMC273]MCZ7478948.1 hypothetical protein [Micromonospora sp. WMMC273]